MQNMTVVRALTSLWSQRPSLPAHSLIDRSRVDRRRHHGVPVTWIDGARAAQATIVHLHGGAYLHGERPAHWEWLEEITRRAGTAGAMVHYRMPPRFPFPVAYDDALEAVRELVDTAVVRSGRWVLSGDSAGAGLALAVAQALRDQSIPLPALLLLTSPWADLTGVRDGDAELRRAAPSTPGRSPPRTPASAPCTATCRACHRSIWSPAAGTPCGPTGCACGSASRRPGPSSTTSRPPARSTTIRSPAPGQTPRLLDDRRSPRCAGRWGWTPPSSDPGGG